MSKVSIFFRDLGEHLKSYVDRAYKENKFESDIKYWDKQYISLQILVKNEHKNKYQRSLNTTATGLTAEQCNLILSNDILNELEEENQSLIKRIFSFGRKKK